MIYEQTTSFSNLKNTAEKIIGLLRLKTFHKKLVVSLEGELGSGKTTIIREILYGIGLNKTIPVLSPTFSYYQLYQFENKQILHGDFYRARPEHAEEFIELIESSDLSFIEWMSACEMNLTPDYTIKLIYEDLNHRQIQCFKKSIQDAS